MELGMYNLHTTYIEGNLATTSKREIHATACARAPRLRRAVSVELEFGSVVLAQRIQRNQSRHGSRAWAVAVAVHDGDGAAAVDSGKVGQESGHEQLKLNSEHRPTTEEEANLPREQFTYHIQTYKATF